MFGRMGLFALKPTQTQVQNVIIGANMITQTYLFSHYNQKTETPSVNKNTTRGVPSYNTA